MAKQPQFRTGYAAKKRKERAVFYRPLSDGFKPTPAHTLADTFMPAQTAKTNTEGEQDGH